MMRSPTCGGVAGNCAQDQRLSHIYAGKSESPEQIERGYMHGFTVDLDSWEALAATKTILTALGARL